ncbi:MAG: hypothetical protein WHU10_06075 [Fimbriimonadales bacterium]
MGNLRAMAWQGKAAAVAVALVGCGVAWAQGPRTSPFSGRAQYPQFRFLSGLSGGGFGVDRLGRPNPEGAMALSTPIGYALAHGRWAIAAGSANEKGDWDIAFDDANRQGTNGTAAALYGLGLGSAGRLTASVMVLSSVGDNVYNLQWQPPGQEERAVVASVGVQDAEGTGGTAGDGLPTDGRNSASGFVAATWEARPGLHVTLGAGTARFRQGFGSVSWSALRGVKLMAEHDGYGWNLSGAVNLLGLGRLPGDPNAVEPQAQLHVGWVNERAFYVGLGFAL